MNIAFKNSHLMMLAASVLVVSSCATKAPQKSEPELEPEQAVPVKPVEKPKPKYIQVAERDADRIGKDQKFDDLEPRREFCVSRYWSFYLVSSG